MSRKEAKGLGRAHTPPARSLRVEWSSVWHDVHQPRELEEPHCEEDTRYHE